MPGGNRGSFPSAMYPTHRQIVAPLTVGKRTERHLYALPGVEDDRRVILGTVTSELYVDNIALTAYGILDSGTESDE